MRPAGDDGLLEEAAGDDYHLKVLAVDAWREHSTCRWFAIIVSLRDRSQSRLKHLPLAAVG